ncbi:aminotransferase class IV-domain-containing protein [Delphinella strobiligena]|nr:aminotransferase class IV-domain-containing protein [Delphinella strobiligena]
MLEEIPLAEQYVFTSLRYEGNSMKPGLVKRHSSMKGKSNPVCKDCPDASKSAYLMKYHYERLICAADHLGWYDTAKMLKGPVELFNRVEKAVTEHKKQTGNKCPFKVRICLRHNGRLEIGVEPILATKPPLLFPTTLDLAGQTHCAASTKPIFKAVTDVLPTRTTTHTRDKTYYRTMYNYARHCANIQSYQDAKEVILYNADNFVMDGSITTPYFFRDGKWITPHTECGGQQGTTRRWAIDQGLCMAGFVQCDSLRHDEIIWLSNGVKGFFTARIIKETDRISRTPSYDSRSSGSRTSVSDTEAEASGASSRSSVDPPLLKHEDEEHEDDIEPRRKYPPVEGSDDFRNTAFSLDVFERSLKL